MRSLNVSKALLTLLACVLAPRLLCAGDPKIILKKGVFPTHPGCALAKRVQGTVRIRAVLNSKGFVTDATPVDSHGEPVVFPELKDIGQFGSECLCQAAQKAASFWAFEESSKLKQVVITFRFELVDSSSAEGLYPVFLAPTEVTVRGLLPSIEVWNTDMKR